MQDVDGVKDGAVGERMSAGVVGEKLGAADDRSGVGVGVIAAAAGES